MKHPVLRITLLVASLMLLAQSARADQALVFTVKTHKENRGQHVQNLQAPPKPHVPEEAPVIEDSVGEQTIILGPDYFVVDDGDHKEIYDFSKREEVVLNAKKKTY